jgi:hypothetical protein
MGVPAVTEGINMTKSECKLSPEEIEQLARDEAEHDADQAFLVAWAADFEKRIAAITARLPKKRRAAVREGLLRHLTFIESPSAAADRKLDALLAECGYRRMVQKNGDEWAVSFAPVAGSDSTH